MIPSHATISDTEILKIAGPWHTKSGGDLNVLISLHKDVLDRFFHMDLSSF